MIKFYKPRFASSKFDYLKKFHVNSEKFKKVKSMEKNNKREQSVCNNASDIYFKLLNDYELEYAKFSNEKKKNWKSVKNKKLKIYFFNDTTMLNGFDTQDYEDRMMIKY